MPLAVTHILVPILLVAIFRDFYLRKLDKKNFPLHYVLIAGIGGALPDIDFIVSLLFKIAGATDWYVHRTFTHSLFFPLVFFILFLIILPMHKKVKICNLGKHKLKIDLIFLILAFGVVTHIILDSLFGGSAFFFYPFLMRDYGINLVNYLRDLLPALKD